MSQYVTVSAALVAQISMVPRGLTTFRSGKIVVNDMYNALMSTKHLRYISTKYYCSYYSIASKLSHLKLNQFISTLALFTIITDVTRFNWQLDTHIITLTILNGHEDGLEGLH